MCESETTGFSMTQSGSIETFWRRWNHQPSDSVSFARLHARIVEVARDTWNEEIKPSEYLTERFAFISGTPYVRQELSRHNVYHGSALEKLLNNANTLFSLIEPVQFLLWTLSPLDDQRSLRRCCNALNRVFDITPSVPVQVVLSGKDAVIYPTGAELLDEEVIERNLLWLEKYPAVLKPFQEALKIYSSKDVSKYRNMLDSLRFAVEQMVRTVLENEKSLENQKDLFLSWLKTHGAHSQIVNMYNDLLFGRFAQYQNDAVKHKEDQYTPAEVEFVLYLTGTFLRFIQRVAQDAA